ncbi:MAG: GNAT family N-acetyltransferase [Verrucomicrobiales bacterium]|nr:GNAT family N-acetyltransferase [Verrucomicrobiales bacterium]
MEAQDKIEYLLFLPEELRSQAAELYDEAFGKKFSLAIRSRKKRIALFEKCFMLDFAIAAISGDTLVGLAGFHDQQGSLTGGVTHELLISELGFLRGNWAALVFLIYDRKPAEAELVMDGIVVSSEYRGQGIGGHLLEQLFDYAEEKTYECIRLDVIDTNPRAKKLYQKKGFEVVKEETYPYLRWLLGFGGSTIMQREL